MKTQLEKSDAHIALQPKNMEKNSVRLIMMYDIAGYGTGEIAAALSMTDGRVSIIKNSPLYREERNKEMESLKARILDEKKKEIIDNPARKILTDMATQEAVAREKVKLALDDKSSFVRNAATSEILAFGGILPNKQNEKPTGTTVVLEEKMARRFGFAKNYTVPAGTEVVERRVIITQE